MGETTFVNSTPAAMPTRKAHPVQLWLDVPLVIAIAALIIFGLLMVYSASWDYAIRIGGSAGYVLFRQVRWVLVGCLVAFILSRLDYHRYQRWALLIMAGTILTLIIVLATGDSVTGYNRTLLNTGSIQPSELAKLSIILYLSVWLVAKRELLKSISFGLVPMMTIIGFIAGLIALQPDFSAAFTIILLGLLLFFLGGGEIRHLVMLAVVALGIGFLMVSISARVQDRLDYYLAGLANPVNASYHIQRCTEAIVRGGVFGVGIGKGTTKFTNLPFPWTDSIFAIIAEETGLIGATVTVGLFLIILWRGLKIAKRAKDDFGQLLASGITLWIVLEAFINIGVMVNLVPFAGNALPLISAGGSSMVTTLAGLGILMNISRSASAEPKNKEGRSFGAVIDLRRRDRRRRLPGNVHPAGTRQRS